jgi:hypothetical protein
MRIDHRLVSAPVLALSFAIACGDSESTLGKGGTGGSDSGTSAGGSSNGGAAGNTSSTGGRATGTGGRTATGGSSGSTAGGASGAAGSDASAGASGGDGGPTAAGGTAGSAGAGGAGTGGAAAGGAGGRAAGGAGGSGTGGGTVGTACQRLGACCPTAQPPALRTSCTQYSSSGNQTQCGALLTFYCGGMDAGPPGPQPDAANACSALSACCPQAGAQRPSCEQTVAAGNPGLCSTILSILCP